jgi:hypothetical protein
VLGTWAMALLEPQVPLMDALFEVTSKRALKYRRC